MLNQGRIGVGDKARDIVKGYIGVDGKARKIKKIYVGDINGKARLAWTRQLQAPRIAAGPPQTDGLEYSLGTNGCYTLRGIGTAITTKNLVIGPTYSDGYVDSVAYAAFKGNATLKNVTIRGDFFQAPEGWGVWRPGVGSSVFEGCTSLERVRYQGLECVANIQSGTFRGCTSLHSVSLPRRASAINATAFEGCPIKDVYYADTRDQFAKYYTNDEGPWTLEELFPNATIHYESVDPYFPSLCIYDHPGNLATAFDICVDGKVVYEENVGRNRRVCKLDPVPTPFEELEAYLEPNANLDGKPGYMFSGANTTVKDLVIASEYNSFPTYYLYDGGDGFAHVQSLLVYAKPTSNGAFHPSIGQQTFEGNSNLERVCFVSGAGVLQHRCFADCSRLHSVSLPVQVSHYYKGNTAFEGSPIKDVYYAGTPEQEAQYIGGPNGESLAERFPGATIHYESVDPYFTEIPIYNDPVERLPDPPVTIESVDPLTPGGEALYGKNWFTPQKGNVNTFAILYSDLEELRIPEKAVTYTDSVERYVVEIDASACQLKSNLRNVYLPDTIVNIYRYAFQQCPALEKVHLSQSLKTIGDYVFRGCTSLERIVLPDSLESLGAYAFGGCTSLRIVTLGPKVAIGNNAFNGCASLKYIFFTGTPEEWDTLEIGTGNEALTGAAVYFVNYFEVEPSQLSLPLGTYQLTAVAKAEGYENSPPSEAATYTT